MAKPDVPGKQLRDTQRRYTAFLDGASIAGIIAFLLRKRETPFWTILSAVETTLLIMTQQKLAIAAGPEGYSGVKGLHRVAGIALSPIVVPTRPNLLSAEAANEDVTTYANTKEASIALRETFEDPSYEPWLDTAIEHFWIDHASMLNGLFNKDYIPLLAPLLSIGERDLLTVWKLTVTPYIVETWVRTKPEVHEDFLIAKKAFGAAALLRGRFHDCAARKERLGILHHPFRRRVLAPMSKGAQFAVPDALCWLCAMILDSARQETTVENRIWQWADNVLRVRNVFAGDLALDIFNEEVKGDEAAQKLAKDCRLTLYPRQHGVRAALVDANLLLFVTNLCIYLFAWEPERALAAGYTLIKLTKKFSKKTPGEWIAPNLPGPFGRPGEIVDMVRGRIDTRVILIS